jgi:pyrroloquinoline quinone (PQQ) biosynthesis protein C
MQRNFVQNWEPSLGDWRTHMAMIIGNCDDDEMVSQAIERLGDNLRE